MDIDGGRACIQTVFDEFLDHRCRALDDLSGCNFFNDRRWK